MCKQNKRKFAESFFDILTQDIKTEFSIEFQSINCKVRLNLCEFQLLQ